MNINSILPELYALDHTAEKLKAKAIELVSWDLTQRQICDLELIMNRGFYPLDGFLTQKDYEKLWKICGWLAEKFGQYPLL